jgi:hypothetical protein
MIVIDEKLKKLCIFNCKIAGDVQTHQFIKNIFQYKSRL